MNSGTLRSRLRSATAPLHDQLDASMSADLSSPQAYGRFLRVQLAARAPVEAWLAGHASPDLVPPPMASLLVDDLSSLGLPFSLASAPFALPDSADPLGAAWALAGSHLGNRAMLAQLGDDARSMPTAFLSDLTMAHFWRGLLPRLAEKASTAVAGPMVDAAERVFAHFLAAERADRQRLAA